MRRSLCFLGACAVLAAVPAGAFAQDDLGGLLGTTVLNNTLTGINLPQVPVPSVPGSTTTTPTTGQQPAAGGQAGTTTKPAHAPGYYCRAESKKHVAGQKGTPFSQCVTAMAKLQNGDTASATDACKPLSRKHVKGMKRTPYATCVAGGRRLLLDQPS